MSAITEYQQRAQQHRPQDESAMARECYRLHATGLTARDIAAALRLDLAQVLAMLNVGRIPLIEDAAETCARVWNRHATTHAVAKVP